MAAELDKEGHRIFRITAFEYMLSERCGSFGIKDAFLLKQLPAISVQHLCPKVGIVTRSITVITEDMLEIG